MNLLFVVGGYYPLFSATGNCISKIASFLSKQHNIYILSEKKSLLDCDAENWHNQKIFRISTPRTDKRLRLIKSNRRISLFFHKIKYFFSFLKTKGGLDNSLVNAYLNKIRDICNKNSIDAILPCCMPIEGVYASYLFSKSNLSINSYPILFDLYSDSDIYFRVPFIKKIKSKNAFKIEEYILNQAKSIFYVDNWKKYFAEHHCLNAIHIEHPLIEKPIVGTSLQLNNKNVINIIYQGELNYEIRNPKYAISILKKILAFDNNCSISLHFFSFGNANREIEIFSKNNSRCILYGKVEKELADSYFNDSNIVLIIGNSNPDIMPSKVFEAISSCKPILYIGPNGHDCVIDLLSKYNNKFIITPTANNQDVFNNLRCWIANCINIQTSFSDVLQSYKEYTPSYISNLINKYLKNG